MEVDQVTVPFRRPREHESPARLLWFFASDDGHAPFPEQLPKIKFSANLSREIEPE
jgi:hypothetical protein